MSLRNLLALYLLFWPGGLCLVPGELNYFHFLIEIFTLGSIPAVRLVVLQSGSSQSHASHAWTRPVRHERCW